MRLRFSSRLPLIRKKRFRGNSLVTSPDLNFTLRRITPRIACGVWVKLKAKGKRQKAKSNTTRLVIMTLLTPTTKTMCWSQSHGSIFAFYLFTFTFLKIRTARKLQIRQAHAAHENLI